MLRREIFGVTPELAAQHVRWIGEQDSLTRRVSTPNSGATPDEGATWENAAHMLAAMVRTAAKARSEDNVQR